MLSSRFPMRSLHQTAAAPLALAVRGEMSTAMPRRLPHRAPASTAFQPAHLVLRRTMATSSQRPNYHADPMTGELTGSSGLDSTLLVVEQLETPKAPAPSSSLVFGHHFSDHMLTANWNSARGWEPPRIHPYRPFTLDPSSSIFHYAQTLFEGMKAYKDLEGRIRLFRPDMNMARLNTSARRLALPPCGGRDLIKLIAKLLSIDANHIPAEPGYSIYIRPTLMGTQAALGVHPADDAMLFVIMSPVGPYFKSGFQPVALDANPERVRAWPKGTGAFKIGGNYATTLLPQREAVARGYSQNLWLHGEENWVTEVGAMNMFMCFKKEDGVHEIVTPPLNGLVLPGVTRDSILTLLREHESGKTKIQGLPDKIQVTERDVSMHEIDDRVANGTLTEMFGSGTAVVIAPVDRIGFQGRDINIPVGEKGAGPIAQTMLKTITDIQLGRVDHPWSVVIDDLL